MVKLFIIISSGMEAKGKALTGMMFAKNAKIREYAEDVRVIFFGPSEQALGQGDPDFVKRYKELTEAGVTSSACVYIARENGMESQLTTIGLELEPIGSVITRHVAEGYEVITF